MQDFSVVSAVELLARGFNIKTFKTWCVIWRSRISLQYFKMKLLTYLPVKLTKWPDCSVQPKLPQFNRKEALFWLVHLPGISCIVTCNMSFLTLHWLFSVTVWNYFLSIEVLCWGGGGWGAPPMNFLWSVANLLYQFAVTITPTKHVGK